MAARATPRTGTLPKRGMWRLVCQTLSEFWNGILESDILEKGVVVDMQLTYISQRNSIPGDLLTACK